MDKKLTNRQTIGVLDGLWSNPLFGEAHRQAFEIGIKAIKALEQEPCEDAISRQEAVQAFQMFREYESNRSNKGWVNRIETVLNQLPPVNPQNCDKCEVGNPCLYCRHEFEPQESEKHEHMTADEFAELFTERDKE